MENTITKVSTSKFEEMAGNTVATNAISSLTEKLMEENRAKSARIEELLAESTDLKIEIAELKSKVEKGKVVYIYKNGVGDTYVGNAAMTAVKEEAKKELEEKYKKDLAKLETAEADKEKALSLLRSSHSIEIARLKSEIEVLKAEVIVLEDTTAAKLERNDLMHSKDTLYLNLMHDRYKASHEREMSDLREKYRALKENRTFESLKAEVDYYRSRMKNFFTRVVSPKYKANFTV